MLKRAFLIINCLFLFQNAWAYTCPIIDAIPGGYDSWFVYPPEQAIFSDVRGPRPKLLEKILRIDFSGATAENHNNYITAINCRYVAISDRGNAYDISATTLAGNFYKPNNNWKLNPATNTFQCNANNKTDCGFE